MNKCLELGRLTKDPEIRSTNSGKSVAQFTLAVDRPFLNQQGQRELCYRFTAVCTSDFRVFGKPS